MTKKLNIKKAVAFAIIIAYIIIFPVWFVMNLNNSFPINNMMENAAALLWVFSIVMVYGEVENNRR